MNSRGLSDSRPTPPTIAAELYDALKAANAKKLRHSAGLILKVADNASDRYNDTILFRGYLMGLRVAAASLEAEAEELER